MEQSYFEDIEIQDNMQTVAFYNVENLFDIYDKKGRYKVTLIVTATDYSSGEITNGRSIKYILEKEKQENTLLL